MHIGVAGPISTENISQYLNQSTEVLPHGYYGAPLLGTLIGELLKRGHTVSVFTTSTDIDPSASRWVEAAGERIKVYYCGSRQHSFRPKNGMLGRAADFFKIERACLENTIKTAKPDVIHAFWSYEFGLAALASGLPHVITCEDAPHVVLRYIPNLYRFFRLLMARQCLKKANILTAVSPYLQNEIQRYTQVPVSVVPNPLAAEFLNGSIAIDRQSCDLDHPVISMVLNGWDKRKNPKPALKAFKLLRNRYPSATLELYGSDYGSAQTAERWARKQGLEDGVLFVGRLPYDELLKRVAMTHVLLHPALEETFGMVIAEAMGLGVPVVGGRRSGAVPWVIGGGGMTVDVTNAEAISHALLTILGDKKRYLDFANTGFERVKSAFSVRTVVDLYEDQYRRAIAKT